MWKMSVAALLCALALLTACGGEEPLNWTPSPAVPAPTASLPMEEDAPWSALTVADLPAALAKPEDMAAGAADQILLLGCKLEKDIFLYGLGQEYGGGILLRRGEVLTHFDQEFVSPSAPALPELYLTDSDGEEALAVRYLMSADGDRISYDLHLYTWDGAVWTDCAATHDACARKAMAEVTTDRDGDRFTLSYGATSAVYQLPDAYRSASGQLVLDSCFFREEEGVFTVVLGARLDVTGVRFANILAAIDWEGTEFSLRDIRIEPTTVV